MKSIVLAVLFAASLVGQALNQTTLANAVSSSDAQIPLVTSAGVNVGDLLYVDREAMRVKLLIGASAFVERGALGTGGVAHSAGATAYSGPRNRFFAADASGSCALPVVVPYISLQTGNQFACTAGNWTQTNGGGGGGSSAVGAAGTAQISDGAGALAASAVKLATPAQAAGVEILSTTNFASGFGNWTVSGDGTGWTIVGGNVHHTPASNTNKLTIPVTFHAASAFKVVVNVVSQVRSTGTFMNFGVDCFYNCTPYFNTGLFDSYLIAFAPAGSSVVEIQPQDAAEDITISSVQVFEFTSGAVELSPVGAGNIALSSGSLIHNTIGADNFAVGTGTLEQNTTGNSNTAIGENSLNFNTTGTSNVAFGFITLANNTTGNNNIAIGPGALFNNTTGTGNVVHGLYALTNNATGNNNVAFGDHADQNGTGSNNICIGANCALPNVSGDNQSVIGNDQTVSTLLKGSTRLTGTSTDPVCTAAGDIGKTWLDITSSVTTHLKVCGNVASTPTWVQVF